MAPQETDYKKLFFESQEAYFNLRFATIQNSIEEVKKKVHDFPCQRLNELEKEVEGMKEELRPIKQATEGSVFYSKHPFQFKMVALGVVVFAIASIIALLPSLIIVKRYTDEVRKSKQQETEISKPQNNGNTSYNDRSRAFQFPL